MQAEEREHAHEQRGHEPKDLVEDRVVDLVERVGVRRVFGELCVHARMALRAGADDLVLVQPRALVAHGKHIVVAVAVVARGDIGGDVGAAERHRLAVIRLAIVHEPILVALAATLVAACLEVRRGRFLDVVRAVAVGADRALLVAL
jgi:hypothetical protein